MSVQDPNDPARPEQPDDPALPPDPAVQPDDDPAEDEPARRRRGKDDDRDD
jgi:hypothetical protein